MNWLCVVKLIPILIKYGPLAFDIVSEIWELIKKTPKEQQKRHKQDLKSAHYYYKLNNDRDYLRDLRDRLKEQV